MEIAPPNVLATSKNISAMHGSGSLVRSLDSGRTFERLNGAVLQRDASYVTLEAAANGHLFLASTRGVFRSTDRGVSFTKFADDACTTPSGPTSISLPYPEPGSSREYQGPHADGELCIGRRHPLRLCGASCDS